MADDPIPSTSSASPSDAAATDAVPFAEFYGNYVRRRLYVEEMVNMYNLPKIVRDLGTREQCVIFSVQNQLIPDTKLCPIIEYQCVLSTARIEMWAPLFAIKETVEPDPG
ncbi:hypothetical protein O0L34_g19458 [Tuta absoluta]|nr:hypothetical protein O0L34_g19458 [Tuta absoluta]